MKRLLIFGVTKLEDMLEKGNVWYVRHYEAYFDEVYVVYLRGEKPIEVKQGRTTLVSLGKGNGFFDILLAPCRLFKFAKKIKPTHYLTADLVFSWWNSILIRFFLKAKIILMPVCIPENIYQTSGQKMSPLPRIMEKIMTKLCFLSADKILTTYAFGNFVDWLSKNKKIKDKVIIVEIMPEALPAFDFLKELKEKETSFVKQKTNYISLLYIGRLAKEKMVKDLILMIKNLKDLRPEKIFYLMIIGEGPEKDELKKLAESLEINQRIKFLGYLKNKDLVDYYLNADIFVSPLTGTALREAGLCGLPIVAYNTDWVKGFLKNEENALLVPVKDIEKLAQEIIRLTENEELKEKIAKNIKQLAWRIWGGADLAGSLKMAFEGK